jgi:hypothetical protein
MDRLSQSLLRGERGERGERAEREGLRVAPQKTLPAPRS